MDFYIWGQRCRRLELNEQQSRDILYGGTSVGLTAPAGPNDSHVYEYVDNLGGSNAEPTVEQRDEFWRGYESGAM